MGVYPEGFAKDSPIRLPGQITVSLAAELVAVPWLFVMMQRYCCPFLAAVAVTVSAAVLAPVMEELYLVVVPRGVNCHSYCRIVCQE